MGLAIFLFLTTLLLSTSHAEFDVDNPIRLPGSGYNGFSSETEKINCQSFRVGVEAYNLRNWKTVPAYCKNYIENYFTGKQYTLDLESMTAAAVDFAKHAPIPLDLRPNVWVFDLDETLLSNIDYLNRSDVQFGALPFNYTSFYQWVNSENATAPALPAIKFLYDTVLSLGYKIVILTETHFSLKEKRISDLEKAGYSNWETIIFRSNSDLRSSIQQYKSRNRAALVNVLRYRIVGNVGDQWADLTGSDVGMRTFKVPNPAYYVV